MKKIFVFAVILFFSTNYSLYSQDIILLKNGEEIKALVNEVSIDIIKYKKFENPDGPLYTIEKKSVVMITYKNGYKDIFSEPVKEIKQEQNKPLYAEILTAKNGVVRKNGVVINKNDVKTLMENNSEALGQYSSGMKLISTGNIFAYAGLGVVLIAAIVENKGGFKDNSAAMVGVIGGVACLGTSMAVTFSGRSKIKKSVNLYNADLSKKTSYQVGLGIGQNGLAVVVKF